MANPVLQDPAQPHEGGVVEMDLVYTIGASGALTAEATYVGANSLNTLSKGIKTLTRTTNGTYKFTLGGVYIGTTNLSVIAHIQGAYTTTDGWVCEVTSDTTNTTSSGPAFILTLYPNNGSSTTATDPKSGNRLHVYVRLKNITP